MPAAARPGPIARQLGGYHLCIVQNQPVAGWQQVGQIPDVVVQNLLPMAVHDH
jgi:hypothetical protein